MCCVSAGLIDRRRPHSRQELPGSVGNGFVESGQLTSDSHRPHDVSVRSLAVLGVKMTEWRCSDPALTHIFAGFLPTVGHPSAVALASYFVSQKDNWYLALP